MGQSFSLPIELYEYTKTFYTGLFHYYLHGNDVPYLTVSSDDEHGGGGGTTAATTELTRLLPALAPAPADTSETALFKQHARIHLYSLASNFYLYDKRHYRKGTYRDDLVDNLRNVAIPGTGMPLSWIARSEWATLAFLCAVYPGVSFIAAVQKWFMSRGRVSISDEYATRLLAPDDWFNYWRLNCNLVGLHALLNDFPADYDMENKWTFLQEGAEKGVPVSPFLKTAKGIVVKHRNEEGGLGIFFYKNAAHGGDWILQERIENSDWVSTLLPPDAPLSTFRVMTCSRAWDCHRKQPPVRGDVKALSCVFRAGRAGASTDHDSVLFDVDVQSGLIRGGTTNAHWYRLGLLNAVPGRVPWRSSHNYKSHPDGDIAVTGNYVPDITRMLSLVEQSHLDLCPRVPIAGWDVVLSSDPNLPVCLLEVNLSCNFFRGSFDRKYYFDFVDGAFSKLHEQRRKAAAATRSSSQKLLKAE